MLLFYKKVSAVFQGEMDYKLQHASTQSHTTEDMWCMVVYLNT